MQSKTLERRAPRGFRTCRAGVSEKCKRIVKRQEIVNYRDIRMCLDCKAEFHRMEQEE